MKRTICNYDLKVSKLVVLFIIIFLSKLATKYASCCRWGSFFGNDVIMSKDKQLERDKVGEPNSHPLTN